MSSSPIARTPSPRIPWLYLAGCLLILAGALSAIWRWSTPAKAETAVAPINASPWRLQNIEAIRVGQRVVTDAANRTESLSAAVDPATWRRVTIVGTREMASGKEDRIVVQTIVPPTWLEFFDAHVGAVVPYPLDLVEMGIPEELEGEITDIAPCPKILDGPGRVVLTIRSKGTGVFFGAFLIRDSTRKHPA
ncbi:hypothetical protein M4951_04415 [Blastopirellula sp. J2-11]|uniref:hypothetical protein n=1 Tax=Blastopirellula sp. J2-11 TaxID=2943192 RepID=UPI0021C5AE8D|nr:hypothetical protein [Blastopirellula sp. J2-11]UUO07555.1 hypothetical protein M4951_04415 [Blastopirellula sp. J2-11]